MTRYKLKRTDFWIYITATAIVSFGLGIFATFCFSTPSSEASSGSLGAGFFGAVAHAGRASALQPEGRRFDSCLLHSRILADLSPIGADFSPPLSTPILVSAYCPCEKCCGKFADGITASGHIIQPGDRFVAAPPEIPLGTLFSIEGYAGGLPVPVLDRGSAIQGNRFDVFFGDHDEAEKWGVQHFEVVR